MAELIEEVSTATHASLNACDPIVVNSEVCFLILIFVLKLVMTERFEKLEKTIGA